MSKIPLAFTKSVKVKFKNGKIWDLTGAAIDQVIELIESYKESISSVDFQLNIEKLKYSCSLFNSRYLQE